MCRLSAAHGPVSCLEGGVSSACSTAGYCARQYLATAGGCRVVPAPRRRPLTCGRCLGSAAKIHCRQPIRPVLKHGPRSLTCARVNGRCEPHRRNESEAGPRGPRGGIPVSFSGLGAPPALLDVDPSWPMGRSKSVHIGTRKMVNYA